MNQSDKFWDGVAEKYAKKPVPDEAVYQRKLSESQRYLSADMDILEFGCGTGTTAIHHAPHVRHIDALDISEAMLAIGREKAKNAAVENITFSRATLSEFKAETASLDAVLGLNVIHLIPDRRAVLDEVARILKPGGTFISSTGCLGNSYFRFIRFIAPIGKRLGLMPDVFVMTEQQWAQEITAAGFTIQSQWHHGVQGIDVFIIARKN
ncbi:class I SAM-dependent methyltransferase [Motiliproteus coralliicola]|uniref:Class I SAM-dependent methyltransferase n=1 Tax=Motiliproteus coralliicola TaxID=2283196 RepID=A0A369WMI6_9GAMM|nr:class I SAM-dependent methyltransferase [Motiliproteus coralliicola]RDE22897.1 class I SAM-dependent methyltransferase [Motiliproteus coralliicola]